MAFDAGLVEWVTETLEPLGTVTMRRMMGGATLYCDGTVFAIAAHDQLWFKADKESDAIWDGENCPRFTVDMGEKGPMTMNYRRAPDEVHDDPDAMRRWAGLALEAGRRAPVRARKQRKAATGRKGAAEPDA